MVRQNKEVLKDLKDRFTDGAKLTVDEIVTDYFKPNSPYAFLIAKANVRGLLHSLKVWFRRKHALWFGNIDSEGHYGLFTEEEEARYGMLRYYRFVKGVIHNAKILTENARDKGLLPSGIREVKMMLSVPEGEVVEEEKNVKGK
jgi:hypothetical protein